MLMVAIAEGVVMMVMLALLILLVSLLFERPQLQINMSAGLRPTSHPNILQAGKITLQEFVNMNMVTALQDWALKS